MQVIERLKVCSTQIHNVQIESDMRSYLTLQRFEANVVVAVAHASSLRRIHGGGDIQSVNAFGIGKLLYCCERSEHALVSILWRVADLVLEEKVRRRKIAGARNEFHRRQPPARTERQACSAWEKQLGSGGSRDLKLRFMRVGPRNNVVSLPSPKTIFAIDREESFIDDLSRRGRYSRIVMGSI
jgi:hypothetical protein